MKPRSIGARLTLWYAGAFAVALLLLGGAMWLTMQQSLYHAIDQSLHDRMAGIRVFIEDHKNRLYIDEVKEEFYAHGDLFQVRDADGRLVHQADTLRGEVTPGLAGLPPEGRLENVGARAGSLRFLSQNLDVDGRTYTVQVAAPLRDLQQGLHDALWLLIPMFPIALLLASACGYWVSRRALAPVDRITQTARTVTAESLAQRLEVPPTGDELARLSETLNDMIGRLESSFCKISQFTADASHELRTPLAIVRTTAEVALRAPTKDEHREALERIVAEVGRTSQLLDNLLVIAKADAGSEVRKTRVDAAAVARDAAAEIAVLARMKQIDFVIGMPDAPIYVTADPQALHRLLLILLDNAVKYTTTAGRVQLTLEQREADVWIRVRDTGIGIPADDQPLIFDRFYRVDRARSRSHGGAGLGLAIGRWIVDMHQGEIFVESEVDRGSLFSVRLPLVERAA
jgi:heavy metal sensor kinase